MSVQYIIPAICDNVLETYKAGSEGTMHFTDLLALIKKKFKFSSYNRKSEGISKVIYD
jgi:hypothetical protein